MRVLILTLCAAFVLGKLAASLPTVGPSLPEAPINQLPPFPADATAQAFDGKTVYFSPIPDLLPANVLPRFPLLGMNGADPLYLLTLVNIDTPALLLHSFVRNSDGIWQRSITQTYAVPYYFQGRWRLKMIPTKYAPPSFEERITSFRPLAYLDPGTKPPAVLAVVKEVAFPRGAVEVQATWVESAIEALENAEGISLVRFPWA
ncbi:MAG: hypothetical protein M1829_003135 [Trizodia sp. TS-e1964]|nr:MAG: hypothetical protein M1829_003135 [Trizodia sp. TS-e1964]